MNISLPKPIFMEPSPYRALQEIRRIQAVKVAIRELGEAFGEYLITARAPATTFEKRIAAEKRAQECQEAMQFLKEFGL